MGFVGNDAGTISVKAVHADTNDIRRFPLVLDGSLAQLQQKCVELFTFGQSTELSLFWQDEQNDKVRIPSQWSYDTLSKAVPIISITPLAAGQTNFSWPLKGPDLGGVQTYAAEACV